MKIENYKFVSLSGVVYSITKAKWKKHLKAMFAYTISLTKKKPLTKPEINNEDMKFLASDIFDIRKMNQDDCIDIVKEELRRLENGN